MPDSKYYKKQWEENLKSIPEQKEQELPSYLSPTVEGWYQIMFYAKPGERHVVVNVDHFKKLQSDFDIAVEALEFISAAKRSDGTYNRNREACGLLASEALAKIRGDITLKEGERIKL